jgi:hypothetical protein
MILHIRSTEKHAFSSLHPLFHIFAQVKILVYPFMNPQRRFADKYSTIVIQIAHLSILFL